MSISRAINANFISVSNSLSAKSATFDELIVSKDKYNIVEMLQKTLKSVENLEIKVKNLENQLKSIGPAKVGPKGDKGDKGDSITGPKGDSVVGERGPAGPQGKQGDRGLRGIASPVSEPLFPAKVDLSIVKEGMGLVWSSADGAFTPQTIFES